VRAVTIADGELTWQERPDLEPGVGEILVEVHGAGLSRADLLQRAGMYPPPPGVPADIPGLEMAGVVVTAGPGAERFSPGDRVMAVLAGAGQAELAVVHERCAMPVPEPMSWTQAGAFPENVTTAHDALFTQCELAMGERVCIHGAAGGVGTAAVLLASLAGASVVASVRNEEHRAAVAELAPGVEAVAPDDFASHGPYDVILELVGATNLAGDVRSLATGGRIAIIGVGAGARAELDMLRLMSARGRIHGSTLRARPLEQKADAARRVEHHVLALVSSGRLELPIAATFAFEQAAEAYGRFDAGAKLGKIVLLRDDG
jgi:NADPH:quinone reductase